MKETQENISQIPRDTARYMNVLELLDSTKVLEQIKFQLNGISFVNQDGVRKPMRYKEPVFTDEFVDDIILELYQLSNPITAQTHLEREEINAMLKETFEKLVDYYATIGRDHYISEGDWQNILKIHNDYITIEHNGKEIEVSGWYKYLGTDWNENAYVNRRMLKLVKNNDDYSDYSIRIGRTLILQFILGKSALYRSKGGVTLQHHQQVIKESSTIQSEEKKNIFDGLRKRADNIGGR